eukprot:TRINITY_DN1189_c0_g1_i12.p1 TRINITY_DN1189_c0_g1~~TRINITY_DN1189_c0_g1_i12.p1  ORF type:complete len:586 (+),score=149.01 TRINITY_DN1189_c0_g1_i12:50-1807(+)
MLKSRQSRKFTEKYLSFVQCAVGVFLVAGFGAHMIMAQHAKKQDNINAKVIIARQKEVIASLTSSSLAMEQVRESARQAELDLLDTLAAAQKKLEANNKIYQPEQSTSTVRTTAVVKTLRSVWGAYKKHAMGADELDSLSNKPVNWDSANKQMVTLVDSLDTLYITGCHDEFNEAVDYLANHFNFNPSENIALFETTIRVLGGLLSAYALSGDARILSKAVQVGNSMIPAYSKEVLSKQGGVPHQYWNPKTHKSNKGFGPLLAESGSVQLEYRYLSHLTGNHTYDTDAMRVFEVFRRDTRNGLLGNKFDGKHFTGTVSTGAFSDSYYEYLLKLHLLTGQNEGVYKDMYIEAAEGIINHLVKKVGNTTQSYIVEGSFAGEGVSTSDSAFEHLSCFVPGMLALGSEYLDDPLTAQRHLEVAESIGEFCAHLYLDTASGLSPDTVSMYNGKKSLGRTNYGLRPETIESLFYLWRVTRKEVYREWGWKIYQSIEKHCKVCPSCEVSGYSEIAEVGTTKPRHTGHMDTFFTGETLKYLYLLFTDDSALDLDCWVLNTEAHPFPKFMPLYNPGGTEPTPLPEKCSNPLSPY